MSTTLDAGTHGGVAVAVRGLTKRYGGVTALGDVSLDLPKGEITAVVGENGAGKSTLMNILAGLTAPTAGTVEVGNRRVEEFDPRSALRDHGVALVPQELVICPDLSVAENIVLGVGPMRGPIRDHRAEARTASAFLRQLGVDINPHVLLGRLGPADQQFVIVARALARDCRMLILDEPTAVLNPHEAKRLGEILRGLADSGTSIVYVSHRLEELFGLARTAHVLRDGHHTVTLTLDESTPDDLVAAMVGRDLPQRDDHAAVDDDAPVRLAVHELHATGVDGVDLEVRQGEVLGIAGLPDSGRTNLLDTVFGARHMRSGRIELDGSPTPITSPARAISLGISYVPGERKSKALFPNLTVEENIAAPRLHRYSWLGFVRWRAARHDADDHAQRVGVVMGAGTQAVTELSGGNQQKAVIARWLATDPRVLLLDEPTRGVDIGAKAEIYGLVRDQVGQGVAVLLSSSDLPELLSQCDRIAVMFRGRVVDILDGSSANEEDVMALATGTGMEKS